MIHKSLSINLPIKELIKFELVMVQVCVLLILVLRNIFHHTLIQLLSYEIFFMFLTSQRIYLVYLSLPKITMSTLNFFRNDCYVKHQVTKQTLLHGTVKDGIYVFPEPLFFCLC